MATEPAPVPGTAAMRSRRRRWLARAALYSPLAALVLFILLDPFSRQWLLGPTIDGMPLCYWQEQLRVRADPNANQQSLMARVAAYLGLAQPTRATELPSREAIARIALTMVNDGTPQVRASLAPYLRNEDTEETRAALLRLLDDHDPIVRGRTAMAFGYGAPPGDPIRERLTQMLDDPDKSCRLEAAVAICRATDGRSPHAELVLRGALGDTQYYDRLTAIRVLCYYGKQMPSSLAAVSTCIVADSANGVRIVGSADVHSFGPAAVPLLIRLLNDPDSKVRRNACGGLGKLGAAAHDAASALRLRLADADEEVRSAAAEALRRASAEAPPPGNKDEQ